MIFVTNTNKNILAEQFRSRIQENQGVNHPNRI